ncbi:MAG: glycosyltransferase [Candidatus Peribacteria bacterium]|jgi:glycosyltransferase involved in cell wall biosynthesis|nr:glycosyltransferase [Candidatus Peribacteria bacterium]
MEDISILIPCYNDGESIALTIKSVYDSYPSEHFQLIVINDKSTDDSLTQLQILQKQYGFTLIDNEKNL